MPLQETEFSDSLGVLPYLCGNLNWEGASRGGGTGASWGGHWIQLSRVRLYSDGGETLAGQAMILSTGELTVAPELRVFF